MALSNITFANKRRHRNRVSSPVNAGRKPQVERTGLTVSVTGSAVAIRPRVTALRRMDSRGQGTVGYY